MGYLITGVNYGEAVSILNISEQINSWINTARKYPALVFPVIVFVLLGFFFGYYRRITKPLTGTTEWIDWEVNKPRLTFFTKRYKMGRKDIAPLVIITAVFSFLALFQLGDRTAPQSFFQFKPDKMSVTVELQQPTTISSVMYYTGLWTGHYILEFSENGNIWVRQGPDDQKDSNDEPIYSMNQKYANLFKWQYATLSEVDSRVKYIRLTASVSPMELGELALYGTRGVLIPRSQILSPDASELFDEQGVVPARPEYMNSMYFDEIYHGRTAFEHIRNVKPYETTHPPLGKEIIAASVLAFGMTPFGWRFSGAVFGVLMLIALYVLLKNMFGKTPVATCGTLLFGFDFMRFTQTRIATIDTYGVFFILLAFLFMYRYITTDPDASFKKSLVPLALTGIAFGLGCASKWIVPYAGAGLAILYIIRLVMLFRHYRESDKPGFGLYLTKTLSFSVLFFVVVPVIIYCLSYIPYGLSRDLTIKGGMLWNREYYKIIWENQKSMFSYHSALVATHPYSSKWYQWISDARPILYYYNGASDMKSTFGAFGNPIVWWGGFIAMVAITIRAFRRRDGKAFFILIGYLAQLLPWVAVTRVVFVYHYFPSTVFLIIALAHVFNTMFERAQGKFKHAVYGYTAASGVVFGLFYPALTGVYAPYWYFKYFIAWIPVSWPF